MKLPDHQLFDTFADVLKDKVPPSAAPAMFEGDEAQVLAGLAVYRNNVRSSLSRVLGDKFPVLKQLVGEDFFKFLAHEYFHAHPPSSPMVTHYGDDLPRFLEGFQPVEAYPYLPDVARLEIAWLEAYHAADGNVLAPDEIMAAAGEDIMALRFGFHPSVRLLNSRYPIVSIWQRHQGEGEGSSAGLNDRAEPALIARPYKDVTIRVLTAGSFAALESLVSGARLEDALNQAMDADEGFDPQAFFQALFAFQIIAEVQQ